MNTETRGTLSRRGNISQITNAFVEEVNAFSNTSTGYIIVSYAASPGQQSDNIQMLRLNINRNTVITLFRKKTPTYFYIVLKA